MIYTHIHATTDTCTYTTMSSEIQLIINSSMKLLLTVAITERICPLKQTADDGHCGDFLDE